MREVEGLMSRIEFKEFKEPEVDIERGLIKSGLNISIYNPSPYNIILEDASFNIELASTVWMQV